MEREQFTFYASFAKAIQRIRKPADRAAAYDVIIEYALNGTLPDLSKLPDIVGLVFDLVKPNLDASRRKAEGGKRGRSEKDNDKISERSDEDNGKISERSCEDIGKIDERYDEDIGNKKENKKEGENKKEKENKCSLSPLTPQKRNEMIEEGLSGEELKKATAEWVQYKIERREPYKETGLRNLIVQIRKAAESYGEESVTDIIRRSMSANYQGIVFDWLDKPKPKKTTTAADYRPPKITMSNDEMWKLVDNI